MKLKSQRFNRDIELLKAKKTEIFSKQKTRALTPAPESTSQSPDREEELQNMWQVLQDEMIINRRSLDNTEALKFVRRYRHRRLPQE